MPQKIRRRGRQFPLFLSDDEREYISREAYDLEAQYNRNYSQNELIVHRTFKRGWRERLEELRKKQRGIKSRKIWTPKNK